MREDKREKIKAVLQVWAASVLAHWFDRSVDIDKIVDQIIAIVDKKEG